jgi:hypothetical protein
VAGPASDAIQITGTLVALSEALDYFTETVCASKPEATRSSYEQEARHIARLLGTVQLADLTRSHIERYIAKRIATARTRTASTRSWSCSAAGSRAARHAACSMG